MCREWPCFAICSRASSYLNCISRGQWLPWRKNVILRSLEITLFQLGDSNFSIYVAFQVTLDNLIVFLTGFYGNKAVVVNHPSVIGVFCQHLSLYVQLSLCGVNIVGRDGQIGRYRKCIEICSPCRAGVNTTDQGWVLAWTGSFTATSIKPLRG